MKHFLISLLAFLGCAIGVSAESPIAYGIRVYYDGQEGAEQSLIAFPVDNPADISTVMQLDQMFVRAAAATSNGTYYLIHCDDGLVASSLWRLDIEAEKLTKVCDYDLNSRASNLLIMDMTYDAVTKQLYALAFDILGAEVGDDTELDIPFGLFKIDPATGDTELVGYQNFMALVAIAADNYGDLWVIDSEGALWGMNKRNGKPTDMLCDSYSPASMLQSMTFDSDGVLYWAGFDSPEDSSNASTWLGKFEFYEEYIDYNKIGDFPNHIEIVGLWIDNNPLSANAPSRPESVKVEAGAKGALTATLTFTAPATTIAGSTLTGTVDLAVMRVTENSEPQEIGRLTSKTPGAKLSYVDNVATAGSYTYTVVPFNGEGQGQTSLPAETWIGVDAPGAVANLTAAKKAGSYDIVVSWNAPESGSHGGWYDPATLTYTITRLPDNKVMASSTTSTTITDTSITSLEGYSYEVTATTGSLTGPSVVSQHVVSGQALDVPQTFNFSTAEQRNLWTGIANAAGDNWEDYCFTGVNLWCKRFYPLVLEPQTKAESRLVAPPVKLEKGVHYRLTFSGRGYAELCPVDFSVTYGNSVDNQTVTLMDMPQTQAFNMSFEPMSVVFVPETTADSYISFNVGNMSPLWIADVSISHLDAMAIEAGNLSGAVVANVGTPSVYKVEITNAGYETLTDIAVTLLDAKNNALATTTVAGPLAAMETTVATLVWTPETKGTVVLHAVAEIGGKSATSGKLAVEVLGPGKWITIAGEQAESGVSPFYLLYPNSWEQSIFTEAEMGIKKATIKGLIWYYNIMDQVAQGEFDVEIMLGTTDKATFSNNQMIPAEDLTTVFSGTLSLDPALHMLALIFDESFEYSGGNLVVASSQTNSGGFTTDLRWMCTYGADYADRTIYYRGEEAFDGVANGTLQEIPCISFWIDNYDGIESIVTPGTNGANLIATEYYNLQGVRVANPSTGIFIRVSRYDDGSVRSDKIVSHSVK